MTYQPGDILLDKYRIDESIGRGAFAEVYRATHIELNVPRALKVLRKDAPGMGSTIYDDFEMRFRLEVQLGARINHPNVIQVYDVERLDGDLILVMEYAPDGSLGERIKDYRDRGKQFEIEEALQIAVDVADGLGEIHALDAVHRDLKPSNILFDAKGRAKLADLGLAQVPGGPSMRSQLSQPTHHPGTPGYMSPEQEQTGILLRPSSDIYALGLILFELLTDRNFNFVEPGTNTSDLRENVPFWLDELIAQMLAEDPKQRPWDGKRLTLQLKQGLKKNVSDKVPKPGRSILPRWLRWVGLGAVVLAGLFGLIYFILTRPASTESLVASMVPEITSTQAEIAMELDPTLTETMIPNTHTPAPTSTQMLISPSPTAISPGIGSTKVSDVDGMVQVYVPSGKFLMGSEDGASDEQPVHTVYVDAFWMDQTEVTSIQFETFWKQVNYDGSTCGGDDDPVACVSWIDAQAYCQWAGRRLPTEAEWEKAARGGLEEAVYPWGDQSPICDDGAANGAHYANCDFETVPVKSFAPNGYGLYDMAGNVWEWVDDWYGENYYQSSPSSNPQGPSLPISGEYRVLRGGSWLDDAWNLRSSYRYKFNPNKGYSGLGFRCANSEINATDQPQASSGEEITLPDPIDIQTSSVDGMVQVYVPAGEFQMGSEDGGKNERPVHSVFLDAYWMDQTEVTNIKYAEFLNERGNQEERGATWLNLESEDAKIELSDKEWQPKTGFEHHPVVEITWYGAKAYCEWAERRLPSEAEWEKAARGQDSYTFPWGEGVECTFANYSGCVGSTFEVGNNPAGASPYGAQDMIGNVWEWVADAYQDDYYTYSPTKNPDGPVFQIHRVLRGGSWFTYGENQLRSAFRAWNYPESSRSDYGFRCAMDAE
jgi:eukaryotic-like serine/threonine-protein kinase